MSDISGQEEKPLKSEINSKYLNQDKKQQIQAFVSEKKWGKEKKNYYKDDQSQDSEADQEEEIEAEELQKQQLKKQQTDWDVLSSENEFQQIQPSNKIIQKSETKQTKYSQIAIDQLAESLGVKQEEIIKYNKKQLLKQIKKAWPDVDDILKEIEQISTKINKIKQKRVQGRAIKAFNQVQFNLLTGYMATLLFYIQLRSQTKLNETHPIFKKIVDLKTKIEELKEIRKHAELIDFHYQRNNEINEQDKNDQDDSTNNLEEIQTFNLKQKIKDAHKTNIKNKSQQKVQNILEQMDDEIHNKKGSKKEQENRHDIKINMQDLDDSLINDQLDYGEDEFYQQNKAQQKEQKLDKKKQKIAEKQEQFQSLSQVQKLTEVKEDDPRKINYVMLKNISLMRRRRGNRIKNSRVKHKLKYEKAIKKLKSQNKFMKDPIISNYSGENGVKSGIIRGVRLQ
ncbi:Something about silencing protein 10 [Paramecium bursaria]